MRIRFENIRRYFSCCSVAVLSTAAVAGCPGGCWLCGRYSCHARRDDSRLPHVLPTKRDDCVEGFPQHSGFISLHSIKWDRFTGSAPDGDWSASLPDRFTPVRRENVPTRNGTLDSPGRSVVTISTELFRPVDSFRLQGCDARALGCPGRQISN